MADRLDAVNASFEDCEEQDEDVDVMQVEETAPMILLCFRDLVLNWQHTFLKKWNMIMLK